MKRPNVFLILYPFIAVKYTASGYKCTSIPLSCAVCHLALP